MRVAVDTNVLVSAVIADGPPRRVLELIVDGGAEFVLPKPVAAELERVLKRKLGVSDASIEAISRSLEELVAESASVPEKVEAVTGDPADDRILAAPAGAGVEILITGDSRHLLPLGHHGDMRIVRPQDFLAEVSG